MTGLPGSTNAAFILGRSIGDLTKEIEHANRSGFRSLRKDLSKNTDAVTNLRRAFSFADDLQKKSLAVNTNFNKLISNNTAILSKLRGDFFENAEEKLLQFSEGIRENSEGVDLLTNRMKVTGQSTDLLRKITGNLIVQSKGQIDVADRLAKSNIQLGRQYVISNDKLVEAVAQISDLLDVPSVLGLGEGIAQLSQVLAAEAKGLGDKQRASVIKLLAGSDMQDFADRVSLGISDSLDFFSQANLTDSAVRDKMIEYLQRIDSTIKQNFVVSKGSYKNELTNAMLSSFNDKESIIAAIQLNSLVGKQNAMTEAMRTQADQFYMTSENLQKEAFSLYQKAAVPFYEGALPILKSINYALVAGAAGSILGGGGSRLAGLIPLLGRIGPFLRFLGPIGFIGGTIASLLPALVGMKDSTAPIKNIADEARKQTAIQKEISTKIKDPNSDSNKPKGVNELRFDALNNIIDLMSKRRETTKDNEILQELKSLNRNLVRKIGVSSFSNPADTIGGGR